MSFIKSSSLLYLVLILFTGLTSCDDTEKIVLEPKIDSFTLQPEFNSSLDKVVVGEKYGIEIKLVVPYKVSLKNLVVSFQFVGNKVEVNNINK